MALDQYALITATAAINYVGAGTSPEDVAVIQDLINAATSYIEDTVLGRKVKAREFTEYHNGTGLGSMLVLNQYPVVSITSLHDDVDRAFQDISLVATGDYYLDDEEGVIERTDGGSFASGVANVQVIYTGGYNTVPYMAQQACKMLVSSEWVGRNDKRWGVVSRSDGHGDSVTYDVYSGGAKGQTYKAVEEMLSGLIKMRL